MKDKTTLYKAQVNKFSKRILLAFYPYAIIPFIFLLIPFFNQNSDNPITFIWVTIMLSIIIVMLLSSYKWTTTQVASIVSYDNLFEIEIVIKNTTKIYQIDKDNIKTRLEWKGARPGILKLTLFDNENKVAELYSGGKQKMEYALEEIAYKIKKNKVPGTNISLPK